MNAKLKLIDPMDGPRQRAKEITAEIDKLTISMNALQERASAAEGPREAIARFDAEHEAAMASWADSGGHGEAPSMDRTVRSKLRTDLDNAESEARAAETARKKLEGQIIDLTNELRQVQNRMRSLGIARLMDEASEMATGYRENLLAAERHGQHLLELRAFLFRCRSEGIQVAEHDLETLNEALNRQILGRKVEEVIRSAKAEARKHWSDRLTELVKA